MVSKIRIHISYEHQEQEQEHHHQDEPIIDPRGVTARGRVRQNYRRPGFTPLVEGDQDMFSQASRGVNSILELFSSMKKTREGTKL